MKGLLQVMNTQTSPGQTDWFKLARKHAFVFVFCVFVSFIAGFTSTLFWHAHSEPLLYPCPDANEDVMCPYKNQAPPPRDKPIFYYS